MPNLQTRAEKEALLELLTERERRRSGNKIATYFPATGPVRRELYPRHMEFFRAGKIHRERLMCAANRVGKTESVGGYELALHLTGDYPAWWPGYRFNRPIRTWAAGDTSKTVRDILQLKLMGDWGRFGTGLIPKKSIANWTSKAGVAEAVDTVRVHHVSGGDSVCSLKSYDQRRESFQGTEQDIIWLDEEPPQDVYVECVLRTMTNNGLIMLTFTPISGMSEVVMSFMPDANIPEQVPV